MDKNIHQHKMKHKEKIGWNKQPLAWAFFVLERMFYGSKKLIQLSLKPKNPNLSNKTQRRDQKIWAIWKPKTYTSQSVKKKDVELWGSVSIYRSQMILKNRHGRLGCESEHILLRKDRKGCALSSPKGRWAKAQQRKIRPF